MLYPINIDNMVNHNTEMKWAFAPMVDISEEEKENFPNENGGFYEKKIDTDNSKIYDEFVFAIKYVNEKIKKKTEPKVSEIKLPKLKKLDGE
tara:strand:- start:410 stop:685 length:276 start_codon:yes stop_codon:yes gene_type:complete